MNTPQLFWGQEMTPQQVLDMYTKANTEIETAVKEIENMLVF